MPTGAEREAYSWTNGKYIFQKTLHNYYKLQYTNLYSPALALFAFWTKGRSFWIGGGGGGGGGGAQGSGRYILMIENVQENCHI